MGEFNLIFGQDVVAAFGGKELRFSALTQAMKGEFESWLEQRAQEATYRNTEFFRSKSIKLRSAAEQMEAAERFDESESLYAQARQLEFESSKAFSDLSDRIAAGHYSFSGKTTNEALWGLLGTHKLMQILLWKNHPKITMDDCKYLHERYADADIMGYVQRACAVKNADEPEKTPATNQGQDTSPKSADTSPANTATPSTPLAS